MRDTSWRRRLAGDFATCGDSKNRRRDAGATKSLRSLPSLWLALHRSGLWPEISGKAPEGL